MSIDLLKSNAELVRAAWTMMDQTYRYVEARHTLQPMHNTGRGRTKPSQTPGGYAVCRVVEDSNMGGKLAIHKNDASSRIIVYAKRTNGWRHAAGWGINPDDCSASECTAPGGEEAARNVALATREQVFRDPSNGIQSLDHDAPPELVFDSDSKGGAKMTVGGYSVE